MPEPLTANPEVTFDAVAKLSTQSWYSPAGRSAEKTTRQLFGVPDPAELKRVTRAAIYY
jgi:hypothetical protein